MSFGNLTVALSGTTSNSSLRYCKNVNGISFVWFNLVVSIAVLVLMCLFSFSAYENLGDIRDKYDTISSYVASDTLALHRIFLLITTIGAFNLLCLHVAEYNSLKQKQTVQKVCFWLSVIIISCMPFIAIFHSEGKDKNENENNNENNNENGNVNKFCICFPHPNDTEDYAKYSIPIGCSSCLHSTGAAIVFAFLPALDFIYNILFFYVYKTNYDIINTHTFVEGKIATIAIGCTTILVVGIFLTVHFYVRCCRSQQSEQQQPLTTNNSKKCNCNINVVSFWLEVGAAIMVIVFDTFGSAVRNEQFCYLQ